MTKPIRLSPSKYEREKIEIVLSNGQSKSDTADVKTSSAFLEQYEQHPRLGKPKRVPPHHMFLGTYVSTYPISLRLLEHSDLTWNVRPSKVARRLQTQTRVGMT